MYPSPLRYKRETPVREGVKPEKDLEAEDRLIHRLKSNTTLSGRRVLRFGGPNHSKSPSVLVFFFMSRSNELLALPRVTTLWVLAGALRHPAVALLEPQHIILS